MRARSWAVQGHTVRSRASPHTCSTVLAMAVVSYNQRSSLVLWKRPAGVSTDRRPGERDTQTDGAKAGRERRLVVHWARESAGIGAGACVPPSWAMCRARPLSQLDELGASSRQEGKNPADICAASRRLHVWQTCKRRRLQPATRRL